MVNLLYYLTNLLFFDIDDFDFIYYYIIILVLDHQQFFIFFLEIYIFL